MRKHNRNSVRERLRRQKECRYRIGTKRISNTDADCHSDSYRPHLLTARTHGGVTKCTHNRRLTPDGHAPLSSELRHCTAYPEHRPEATWAQPLGPGRAVLTRGVSRRSGSVACIHADASPTEVLACPSCTATHCASNWFTQPLRRFLLTNGFSGTIHRRPICRRGLPSKPWPILCRRRRSRRCSTGCTRKRKIRCRGCAKGMVISTGR